jgi:ketosteroid isomerase-like protein
VVSQENVELVRAALQAFNRRDGAGFDALLASEAEIIPVRAAIEDVSYRGADAGSQYCVAVDQRWENLRWELEDIRDGDDWVLGLGHIRGRGRDSGAVIDATGAWVAELRAGQIIRFQTFSDRDAALKAVGLEE